MMTLKDQLLLVTQTFAQALKLSESRVSTMVFNDGKVLSRLRDGADVTTGRYEKAMAWLSGSWPAGTTWPAEVQRPTEVAQA